MGRTDGRVARDSGDGFQGIREGGHGHDVVVGGLQGGVECVCGVQAERQRLTWGDELEMQQLRVRGRRVRDNITYLWQYEHDGGVSASQRR